jgi:hypothetical protein
VPGVISWVVWWFPDLRRLQSQWGQGFFDKTTFGYFTLSVPEFCYGAGFFLVGAKVFGKAVFEEKYVPISSLASSLNF